MQIIFGGLTFLFLPPCSSYVRFFEIKSLRPRTSNLRGSSELGLAFYTKDKTVVQNTLIWRKLKTNNNRSCIELDFYQYRIKHRIVNVRTNSKSTVFIRLPWLHRSS